MSPGCFILTRGVVSPLSAFTQEKKNAQLKHNFSVLLEFLFHLSLLEGKVLCIGFGMYTPLLAETWSEASTDT